MADRFGREEPKTQWDRGLNYRSDFLKTNKGLFGFIYLCAYCGKPISRKKMQVDHHIAINLVKHNPFYKFCFGIRNMFSNMKNRIVCLVTNKKFVKMRGVNVTYNLLPACAKCNNKKSDKGGSWIIRGYIGGTIWKALNALNNLWCWAWSKPAFKVAVLLLVGFAILQFYFTGGGIISAVWLGIKTFLDTVFTGFTYLFSGKIFTMLAKGV